MESNRRRVAAELGISEIEIRALFRIAEAGSISPKALAPELSVTSGAITGITDRLVAVGYLHRAPNPLDRRSLILQLTPSGNDVMRQMHIDFVAMLDRAGRSVDREQLESAAGVLAALASNLTGEVAEPPSRQV